MDVPVWLQIAVAVATVLASVAAVVSAGSASRSSTSADAAKEAALAAWQDSAAALTAANTLREEQHAERMAADARARRAPYAAALLKLSSDITAGRMVGMPANRIMAMTVEGAAEHMGLQIAADHPSSMKLARWVSTFSREADIVDADPARWMAASSLLTARVRGWIDEPERVMAEIREDPQIPGLGEVDPTDVADFRNL